MARIEFGRLWRVVLVSCWCGMLWWAGACSSPTGQGEGEVTADGGGREVVVDQAPACSTPEVPALKIDEKADKFALTMFHYNIEYVVGGLSAGEGYNAFCPACDDWDNEAVEDWIVRESFAPVVDFYLKYPQWKVNFEMQGYMLEVIAKRFPALLDKLRTLTGRGQMEISSFHYADQLFLAYPREDLERSVKRTKEIFARYCIPLSPVVFNQEGQAGEGRQKFLVDNGYNIGVFPKNLFRYVRGDDAVFWPYYSQYGGYLIVGPGGVDPASGIQVSWLFFDDGELLSIKGKLNPYFAPTAKYDPQTMEAYKAKIERQEQAGYRIAHISEYIAHLKARKVEAKAAPKLLDGTWQPQSTSSIHRWLGGRGLFKEERDNEVRSGNYRARTLLKAAELFYNHWKAQNQPDTALEAKLAEGWRMVFRSQVSDGSGVNPWAGEIFWVLNLNKQLLALAGELIDTLKTRSKTKHVQVNLKDGAVKMLDALPADPNWPEVKMPITGVEVLTPGRTSTVKVWQVSTTPKHYRVRIDISKESDLNDPKRSITVRFPRMAERLIFSPGLMEDQLVDYPLSDFVFSKKEVYLPLSNGLIGLGNSWYAIKYTHSNHLAARIPTDQKVIEFIDNTQPAEESTTWFFDLVEGDKNTALSIALTRNIHPTITR